MREALGRRLDRLSVEADDLLTTAAVVGREFEYETLKLLGEHDDEALLGLLEAGLDARVIEELPRPPLPLHAALMQETLLAELSTTRRVRLHGGVLSDRRARCGSLGLAIARSCPVTCPHCRSRATSRRLRRTELGYRRFQCRTCRRRFNERTGTRFNEIRFPSDVVMLAVLWRLRYKLSLRDVAEMLLERGYQVTHETVRTWEASFAPLLSERLRAKRRGRIGSSWYIDETYVKVAGRWCYLYRAIDGDGQLIDSMLSEHRDKHAARRFFRGLVDVAEARPLRVTTDRHPAYPRAVRWILGRKVVHRTTQYLNNFMEQDHRGVKQRYYPMRGFGSFVSAARFCTAFDELREYFRSRSRRGQHVSLAEQRRLFAVRWRSLIAEMSAA